MPRLMKESTCRASMKLRSTHIATAAGFLFLEPPAHGNLRILSFPRHSPHVTLQTLSAGRLQ